MSREELVSAAERVRPLLRFLNPARAEELEARLDALLAASSAQAEDLEEVLYSDAQVERWVQRDWLERVGPTEEDDDARGVGLMPGGHSAPVPMVPWVCPVCDFIYYQVELGEPIPRCPKDNSKLVRG